MLPDVVVPAEAVAGAFDPILDLTGAAPAYAPMPPDTRVTLIILNPSPQSPDRRPGAAYEEPGRRVPRRGCPSERGIFPGMLTS